MKFHLDTFLIIQVQEYHKIGHKSLPGTLGVVLKLRWQDEVVLEMSTNVNVSNISEMTKLKKCPPGVKIWST